MSLLHYKAFSWKPNKKWLGLEEFRVLPGNIWLTERKLLNKVFDQAKLQSHQKTLFSYFLKLWNILSPCFIVDCFRPYNICQWLFHVILALSRRVWPLWFSSQLLIQNPGFNCNPITKVKAPSSFLFAEIDILTKFQTKRNYFLISLSLVFIHLT